MLIKNLTMKSFVPKTTLLAFILLFSSLSLLSKVRGISLEELGTRAKNRLDYNIGRELVQLDNNEDEEWEINQVFVASKVAYMVTKGEKYLNSLQWMNGIKLWNDVSRFHKRVLARTTEHACYIAHMNPFDGYGNPDPFGFGPFGVDVDSLTNLTAAELTETDEWASRTDSSKTCTTRKMFTMLLPYDFANELDAYVAECVASSKRIVHTGHSYGGALATLAAVGDEAIQPWLITFGAPPIFGAECQFIEPERNVRIINTEVKNVYFLNETVLTYDIISWNFLEVCANAILRGSLSSIWLDPYSENPCGTIVSILRSANVLPEQYPPFVPLHPSGGVTLLPPFPFRKPSTSVFLDDSFAQNSSSVTGQLLWYEGFHANAIDYFFVGRGFNTEVLYPENAMRKYYSKIRELWSEKRLSVSNGFAHGTYCQDDLHCINGTSCASPPGNTTTMCLFNYSPESPPFCGDTTDCSLGEYCVDGLCSAGNEGDFCLGHFDCDIPICIKGRCSTGEKGQPCIDKYQDCLEPRVCNLRHFDFYKLCWNTDDDLKPPFYDPVCPCGGCGSSSDNPSTYELSGRSLGNCLIGKPRPAARGKR